MDEPLAARPARPGPASVAGAAGFLLLAAVVLGWSKWGPYAEKLRDVWRSRSWHGGNLLDAAGPAQGDPSLHGALAFTAAYAADVWPAVVAGLVLAAGVETLLPRSLLLRALRRRTGPASALAGAVSSLPSLMCTCCSAPVAATLRRSGAPASAALAYWLGNPVLNPAVLAFLALVAPWQWVTTRAVVGAALVVGGSALVARLDRTTAAPVPEPARLRAGRPPRFPAALARLALTLLPEYLLVVFCLGLFRGWLFPFDGGAARWGIAAVAGAVTLGTLIVIPTGGEIPIALALAGAGAGLGTVGALLIVLPATSLASMAMVVRAFSPRVTLAAAGTVAAAGVAAAALLPAIA